MAGSPGGLPALCTLHGSKGIETALRAAENTPGMGNSLQGRPCGLFLPHDGAAGKGGGLLTIAERHFCGLKGRRLEKHRFSSVSIAKRLEEIEKGTVLWHNRPSTRGQSHNAGL